MGNGYMRDGFRYKRCKSVFRLKLSEYSSHHVQRIWPQTLIVVLSDNGHFSRVPLGPPAAYNKKADVVPLVRTSTTHT